MESNPTSVRGGASPGKANATPRAGNQRTGRDQLAGCLDHRTGKIGERKADRIVAFLVTANPDSAYVRPIALRTPYRFDNRMGRTVFRHAIVHYALFELGPPQRWNPVDVKANIADAPTIR